MPPPRRASSARLGWIIVGALVVLVVLWYGMSRVLTAREAAREAAAARAAERQARMETLRALKAIESVTGGGANYSEYARRVLDTKVVVDRYLERLGGDPRNKGYLGNAMSLYLLASFAWNVKVTGQNGDTLIMDPRIDLCPAVQQLRDGARTEYLPRLCESCSEWTVPRDLVQVRRLMDSMPLLWECASENLSAAERAINAARE